MGFFFPSAWSGFQDSVNSRTKVRYSARGGNSGTSEGDKVFTGKDQLSKKVGFLLEDIFGVKILKFIFLFFVSCMGHEKFQKLS